MIRAASGAGFVLEGRLRRSAWVNGEFADEVILGMLATDWASGGKRQTGEGEIPDR
jgi:RimJ/RimL family protein N-acetyltransferase